MHLSRVPRVQAKPSWSRWIREVFGITARVKCCIENVASMDEAARREISAELDIQPIKLDPADTLPYGRPRLAWCSEELYAMEDLTLWQEGDYIRAYVPCGHAGGSPMDSAWVALARWFLRCRESSQLFMKSIPRRAPPPFPAGLAKTDAEARGRWEADQFRFPPVSVPSEVLAGT